MLIIFLMDFNAELGLSLDDLRSIISLTMDGSFNPLDLLVELNRFETGFFTLKRALIEEL
jgi:hypothetical protein